MNRIPFLLIYLRLAIGLAIVLLSSMQNDSYPTIAIILFSVGLLTDIFDGIIARRLGVSTTKMRRMDSTVDQLFFICFVIAAYLQCPDFFKTNITKLVILLSTEALTYILCFFKFRKEIATHSIGAKVWTLTLFATLIQVMLQCTSNTLFAICFWVGLLTRIEIMAIVLTLRQWTNDVPSIYHAVLLRKGKLIRRNKLFNG